MDYAFGILILMAINTAPHVAVACLSFRWRKFVKRRWVRNTFSGIGWTVTAIAVFRIFVITYFGDNDTLRFVAAVLGTATNFLMAIVIWLATSVFEKRRAVTGSATNQATSQILGELYEALLIEGHKRRWL